MDSGGFNPRTPCGVRRSFHGGQGAAAGFNPRTPCGVRHRFKPGRVIKCRFQSTHSLRSATAAHHRQTAQKTGFNPRTPCGVRHRKHPTGTSTKAFQSTHSLRSATKDVRRTPWVVDRFQSTHSLRSATLYLSLFSSPFKFQSTHSLRSATKQSMTTQRFSTCFNPRTPCGVRLRPTLYIATQQSKSYFAPTSLKRPSLHGCSF